MNYSVVWSVFDHLNRIALNFRFSNAMNDGVMLGAKQTANNGGFHSYIWHYNECNWLTVAQTILFINFINLFILLDLKPIWFCLLTALEFAPIKIQLGKEYTKELIAIWLISREEKQKGNRKTLKRHNHFNYRTWTHKATEINHLLGKSVHENLKNLAIVIFRNCSIKQRKWIKMWIYNFIPRCRNHCELWKI